MTTPLDIYNASLIEEVREAGSRGLHVGFFSEKYVYASALEAQGVFVSDKLWFRLAQDGPESAPNSTKQR